MLAAGGAGAGPKKRSSWKAAEAPAELEKYLARRNQKYFGQAEGAYPARPSFAERIGWGASAYEAEMALEGGYGEDELSQAGQLMASYMAAAAPLGSISEVLAEEEWAGKMRVWREPASVSGGSKKNASSWPSPDILK